MFSNVPIDKKMSHLWLIYFLNVLAYRLNVTIKFNNMGRNVHYLILYKLKICFLRGIFTGVRFV
jgi:hypothetical protein